MPIRILIADDNASVRSAMRRVLESRHWHIIEAEDGKEAVTKATELRPDLVVLDLVMPVMNGLTASREISSLLPGVPIVMHTLYSSDKVDLEASQAGVRKVVPKSESSVLLSAVEELLDSEPAAPNSEAAPASEAMTPMRRNEDKIREICAQLFAIKNDSEHAKLLAELQQVLHRHIENLRARIVEYPLILERRDHKSIVPNPAIQEITHPEPVADQERVQVVPVNKEQQQTQDPADPQRLTG